MNVSFDMDNLFPRKLVALTCLHFYIVRRMFQSEGEKHDILSF